MVSRLFLVYALAYAVVYAVVELAAVVALVSAIGWGATLLMLLASFLLGWGLLALMPPVRKVAGPGLFAVAVRRLRRRVPRASFATARHPGGPDYIGPDYIGPDYIGPDYIDGEVIGVKDFTPTALLEEPVRGGFPGRPAWD